MHSVLARDDASLHPTALNLLLDFCDLPTFARILCASKSLAEFVYQAIENNGQRLLSRAVCAAATGGEQHQQALEWLLTNVKHPRHVLNSSTDTILNIPCAHLEVAKTLVAAGLQVSWPDMAAAASRGVSGLEVWVAAEAVVGDIPELVRFIYRSKMQTTLELLSGHPAKYFLMCKGLQQLHPADLSTVLQLAVIAPHCSITAGRILSALESAGQANGTEHLSEQQRLLLKQQVTPRLLQQLTETACLHSKTNDINRIGKLSAAADIPTRVILDHLQQAVQHRQFHITAELFSFQQASSIGAGQLVELLQLALQNRDDETITELLQGGVLHYDDVPLRACSLLTADAVCGLVALALQHLPPDSTAHHSLLQLPAAQGIDAAAVAQLLRLAIQEIPPEDEPVDAVIVRSPIDRLLQLPATAQIDADTLASLIQLTIQQGGYSRAQLLLEQDAAQELQARHIVTLLGKLFRLGSKSRSAWDAVRTIWMLPATRQISTADITRLLKGQAGSLIVLHLLLGLPGSRWLDTAVVLQLLLHHVSRPVTMCQILNLPAAQELEAESVQMLLDATLVCASQRYPVDSTVSGEDIVELLCGLPAAAQLDAERVVASVQMCLQAERYVNANTLMKRLASGCKGTLSPTALLDVIETVVLTTPCQHDPYHEEVPSLDALCHQLPGTKDITGSQAADLVFKALHLRHDEHVKGLLRLPGAKQLEPDQIEHLLQQALQAGHVQRPPRQIVTELCALPGAANITPRELQCLLRLAIQQQVTFRDHLSETSGVHYRGLVPKCTEISWQAEWDDILLQLCQLPAATGYKKSSIRSFLQLHLQPAPVAELLQLAIQLQNPTAVIELCHLPGAS